MPLSYSQLSTYRRCPKQYEFMTVKKITRAISKGESFGSSIHNTLKRWGMLELQKQAGQTSVRNQLALFTEEHVHHAPLPLTMETLFMLWRQCFISEGYGTRAEMDEYLKKGERALHHFFHWWQEKPREVVCIEQSFTLSIPEHMPTAINGRYDRIERTQGGLEIIDYKSTHPRSPEELAMDLQLSIYALAARQTWDEPIVGLTLLSITEDGIVPESTTRSDGELRDAATGIRIIAERIQRKDFAPTPSVAVCRHCPYRNICPAKAG